MASPFNTSQGRHGPSSLSPQPPLPTQGDGCPSASVSALRLREGSPTCQPPALSPQQALLLPGTTGPSSTRIRSGMSTASLTTWWLRSSSLRAALCGPARTMTEMCSQTSWPRVRWQHLLPVGMDCCFSLAGGIFPFGENVSLVDQQSWGLPAHSGVSCGQQGPGAPWCLSEEGS